jgi:hypothetical protein
MRGDFVTQTNELLNEAERAARDAETWADLSNFLFNPIDGLVARAYPTREARETFVKTDEYKKVRKLVCDAIERHGLVEGATPRKSGRVRGPAPSVPARGARARGSHGRS